jgi:hypothetical protein
LDVGRTAFIDDFYRQCSHRRAPWVRDHPF